MADIVNITPSQVLQALPELAGQLKVEPEFPLTEINRICSRINHFRRQTFADGTTNNDILQAIRGCAEEELFNRPDLKKVNKALLEHQRTPIEHQRQIRIEERTKPIKRGEGLKQGGAISKATKTRARTALRKSGQDYSEEDVERKAEELHAKYLANKEKESMRAEKREEKENAKNHMITIAVLPEGSPEVDLPRYYAVEKTKNIKYQKKNGETVNKVEKKYKLVNPLTKQRNIAQRQGSKPIDLKRKDIDRVAVEHTTVRTIPLDKFVPADQKKAFTYNRKRIKYDERGVSPKDRPDKSAFDVKERGRPEILPKNVYHHQNKGSSKLMEKLGKLRNPRQPEETKEETHQEEEKDGYEPPPRGEPAPAPPKRGRPKKYQTAEEAKKAKTEMTVASNKRQRDKQRGERQAMGEEDRPAGSGIIDNLKSGFNKAVGKANRFGNFLSQIVTGSTDYSPSARKILEAKGDKLIKSIVVGRTPVQQAITMALNVVSQGQFQSNQDRLNYDKLFHLFTEITLANGKNVRVEKNEVITMTMGFKQDPDTERQEVPMTKSISFRDLLENAKTKMKQKFFAYDSANNNCQDFIMALLQGSGLGTQENYEFIKQNTKQLFEKIPRTRAIAKQITNLGQRINIAKSGGNISSNTIMPRYAKGSQEARDHMAKIRAMRGRGTGGDLGKNLTGNLGRLADSGTDKLINMMGNGMEGSGPKGLKKFKKWTGAIGDYLGPVTNPILEAGRDRLVEGIQGSGPKGLKKFKKWTGAIGDYLGPIANPILEAGRDRLVGGIQGSGMDFMGGGVHIHHHHHTPHSYAEGGNLGYGLSYSGVGPSGRGMEGGSASYGHHNMVGTGPAGLKKFQKWTGAIGDYLGPIANPILEAGRDRLVEGIRGSGPKGLKKFNKWTGAIGDYLGPIANPILEAGRDRTVEGIRGSGPKGLKKFKKWTGAINDYLGPVTNPILEAGRDRLVQGISGSGKGSQAMKEKMARLRAMRG